MKIRSFCQSCGFFTTSYPIRRWRDGSNIHRHQKSQKTKPHVRAQSTPNMTKLATKIGPRKNSNSKKSIWWCEVSDSPDSSEYAPSTNESDADDFDNGAFIDRATAYANQRNQLPQTDSSATTHSWANGSWYQPDPSWQGHWQFYGWRDTRKTHGTHQNTSFGDGYFNTEGSFTGNTGTHGTLLVNIVTHITFRQKNVSVSSAVVNPTFSSMSKRAGELVATLANAKQKPVCCSAMSARRLNDKTADMYYHAVPVSNPDPSNHWSTKLQDVWNEHGFVEKLNFPAREV